MKEKEAIQAGRPPSIVKLNNKAGFILGIDIGRLFTNFIALDLETNIIADTRRKSIVLSNDLKLIDDLEKEIKVVLSEAKVSWNKLLGIGISLPGMVKGKEGLGETYFNFGGTPAREILSRHFNKPIHVEHDLEAMALGELWFGAAKNVKNALCVNVGWGLGLGMIIDGNVYYGADGYAGELGHIQVVKSGDLCYCGKRGCLETVSSGRGITKIAKERISKGATTMLTRDSNIKLEQIDAEAVLKAAGQGDQFSIEIIEEAGRYLGSGIAVLINLLNPALVILGGGVPMAAPYLLDSIRTNAMKHSLVQLNRNVKFVTSSLGNKAGALGVAIYLAQDLFDVEHLNPAAHV
ncbi:MAG: ROK family protein [Candidatus Kryptoniota bacterium]